MQNMEQLNIDELFEKAVAFVCDGKYEEATNIYLYILKKQPRHYMSCEKLADLEILQGNYDAARKYLRKYLHINSLNSEIWAKLGDTYFCQGGYLKAVKYYKKSLAINPDAYWVYHNAGLAFIKSNNKGYLMAARTCFRNALKLNRKYAPSLNELGLYYQNSYNNIRAKEYFLKAIKACADYKYPYFNLAKIYKESAQYERAKVFLLKAIKIDPDYAAALNYLGTIYYEENMYNAAMYYYVRATEAQPEFKYAYYNMSLIFEIDGKIKKAYQVLERAKACDSEYELALQEMQRLKKNFPDMVNDGDELQEDDLKSSTYFDDTLKEDCQKSAINAVAGRENDKNSILTGERFSERFGRNITELARNGKLFPVLGRENEIDSILETLFSLKKNNPLLIGKAGVGKTAVVEGLAQRIVEGRVPQFFLDKEIIEINMGVLVAGTTFRGDFEKRLKNIVEEVAKNKNLILFIDEIHTLLGAGESGGSTLDAANILKPALAKGELRCIGATTIDEYLNLFQKDSALDRRFFKVKIEELDTLSTMNILQHLRDKTFSHFNVEISDDQLRLIIDLADVHLKNRVFPDKAIDVLEKTLSRDALRGLQKVSDDTIHGVIAEFVGYRLPLTNEENGKKMAGLATYLQKRCFGQDEAINRVAAALCIAKSSISFHPVRPDGVFLFLGTSGVGKTYLARQIAQYLYGSEERCVTLNMSEYTESHSVSKLIGSPPGYVGHENVSLLNQLMQASPACVLLLDEVEKANVEVLKLFLRIFEEGVINDTSGRTIYFSNATIIMTSNITLHGATIGFDEKSNVSVNNRLKEYFPIEFINRIDQIVPFETVGRDTAAQIVRKLLVENTCKMFSEQGLDISFDNKVIDYIADLGYDKQKGVRNLERFFEKTIMDAVIRSEVLPDRNAKNKQSGVFILSEDSGSVTLQMTAKE
ncbi:MAG: AAA family ATPase [Spirochaetota bacterium]|nr:AAA family ATPase [Spirochaetota bacterium]